MHEELIERLAKMQAHYDALASVYSLRMPKQFRDTMRDAIAALSQPSGNSGQLAGDRRWPFVESPGDFTVRLQEAMSHFTLIGAVRHVLIENPPVLVTAPSGWLPIDEAMIARALCAPYGNGDVSDMLGGGGDEEFGIMMAALTAALTTPPESTP